MSEKTPPPEGYRLAMWLVIACVAIIFLALSAMYLLNRAGRGQLAMPRVFWVSSGLIMLSSVTMEVARRHLRQRREDHFRVWIVVTLLLGLGFLVAQLFGWSSLQAAGFYINHNLRSGYAYIFTGLHGLHLLGGLLALLWVALRHPAKWTALRRRVSVDAAAAYWHFLDVLWLYLLGLVFLWR